MRKPVRLFCSYRFEDYAWFVHRVVYHLSRQPFLEPYCYSERKGMDHWVPILRRKLDASDWLVVFLGDTLGEFQEKEIKCFFERGKHQGSSEEMQLADNVVRVNLVRDAPIRHFSDRDQDRLQFTVCVDFPFPPDGQARFEQKHDEGELTEPMARRCAELIARRIFKSLKVDAGKAQWVDEDGLPIAYPFEYEKEIIKAFVTGGGSLENQHRLVQQGCPLHWPDVTRLGRGDGDPDKKNPILVEIGDQRPSDARIIVDVRSTYHAPGDGECACCLAKVSGPDDSPGLSFPEAGPREYLHYPCQGPLGVGIVVSGGIAPGINAVIAGIVRRHANYYEKKRRDSNRDPYNNPELKFFLFQDGFEGVKKGRYLQRELRDLVQDVDNWATEGGSKIGTSRCGELLDFENPEKRSEALRHIVTKVLHHEIDILYVIGGDGSMRAARALFVKARQLRRRDPGMYEKDLSIVAVPKTMDNDILWVWQSFGFMSAAEHATKIMSQLATETNSNPRLCVIQLFGSDSGFVVSHAVLASGVCDGALIPEVGFRLRALSKYIQNRLYDRFTESDGARTHGIIALAETAIPLDVEDYIDNEEYPDIGLHEKEKEAIRRFVGSSMVNTADIAEWPSFCRSMVKEAKRRGSGGAVAKVCATIWKSLSEEVQGIIQAGAASGRSNESDMTKPAVVRAINRVLRDNDLGNSVIGRSKEVPKEIPAEAVDLHGRQKAGSRLLAAVRKKKNGLDDPLRERIRALAQSLLGLPLPHEAEEIRVRLNDLDSEVRDSNRVQQDITRLLELIRQRVGRLLLEMAFPGAIKPLRHNDGGRRVHGQTPDELRTGGLRIVSQVLERDIRKGKALQGDALTNEAYKNYRKDFRAFTNEPRHLLRSLPPGIQDIISGRRLGSLAVDNAMAGYTNFMVSQWLTEFVLVPLELVVQGRKRVPRNGIFWKSVLASTGMQETDLTGTFPE